MAELGGHQISTASRYLDASPTAVVGSGGIYRFKDREVNDHVFVTLEYPQGRTVTFSSIESNDFDHITEQFMGTRGTLIIGREGEVLLFGGGDEGKKIESEERPTGIEVTPRLVQLLLRLVKGVREKKAMVSQHLDGVRNYYAHLERLGLTEEDLLAYALVLGRDGEAG